MRYVMRNGAGEIIRVTAEPDDEISEPVSPQDHELIAFVSGGSGKDAMGAYLAASDSTLLRVIEDLIVVLIDRNVILLTDFPEGAQRKLMQRQTIRTKLQQF